MALCNKTLLQNLTIVACGHHPLLFNSLQCIGRSMTRIITHLITEPSSKIRDNWVVKCVEQLSWMPLENRRCRNIHIPPFSD